MRRLYFIKPSRPYNVGEVAGFADHNTANRLVELGAAIPFEQYEAEKKAIEKAQEEKSKPARKKAAKKAAKPK